MIKEFKVYSVICDSCGIDINEDAEVCGYMDLESQEFITSEMDWIKQQEKHYCPDCYQFDDDDKLVIKKATHHQPIQD